MRIGRHADERRAEVAQHISKTPDFRLIRFDNIVGIALHGDKNMLEYFYGYMQTII